MMNRLRKMISHQLPRDTRKPAQILQSYKIHETSHLLAHTKVHMEKFHCSTCGKQFAGKERLAALEDCQNAPNALRSLRLLEPSIGIIRRNT